MSEENFIFMTLGFVIGCLFMIAIDIWGANENTKRNK